MSKSNLIEHFERSASEVHEFRHTPGNEELLNLYGLYKQAKFGNNDNDEPWKINWTEWNKWNAWKKMYREPPNKCMKAYIKFVEELKPVYG